jgi:valyl-tRNA synthetase
MKELSAPALDNVMNGNIKFHPEKFKNTYKHWMENIKDWCISRQLWWGHQIPAWYYGAGSEEYVVAKTIEEAIELASTKAGRTMTASDLKQDEDVLDTWFSSWLWPISVFDGLTKPGNEEIKYYYPTNDLVTAPEIMFFWVARMIIAGYEVNHCHIHLIPTQDIGQFNFANAQASVEREVLEQHALRIVGALESL